MMHLTLLNWEDFKTAPSTEPLINIVKLARKAKNEITPVLGKTWWPPIISHCLGGFGRTGKR